MSQRAIRKSYFTTSSLSSLVGRLGEFTVDITKNTIVVFDGTTAGGIPLAKENHTHTNATDSVAGFMSAGDHVYLYNHTHPDATQLASGFLSAADKIKLDGIPSGSGGGGGGPATSSSIGNTLVLRDGNGDFAAHNVTVNKVIGALQGNADTATNGVVTTGTYSNPTWITTLVGSKITGSSTLDGSTLISVNWSKLTGTAPNVSSFTNDAGYINGSGNTTGTSGGVQSLGGRETASPTARTVILRDAAGRAQVVTPIANNDIANKQYVDAATSGGYTIQPQSFRVGFDSRSGGGAGSSTVGNLVSVSAPPGGVGSNPNASLTSGTTYTARFQNTVTITESGILRGLNLFHDFQNFDGGQPLAVRQACWNCIIEISTDGQAAYVTSIGGLITGGPMSTQNPYSLYTHWIQLDLPYRTQCVIKMYTGVPGVPGDSTFVALGAYTTGALDIWRYTKNP